MAASQVNVGITCWLFLTLVSVVSHGYRVLLVPTPFQSHLNYFIPFGQGLAKANHEVYMILSSGSSGIEEIQKKGINTLLYQPPDGICQLVSNEFLKSVSDGMFRSPDPGTLGRIVAPAVAKECDNFLLDDGLLRQALDLNFDIAVVDGLFFARCLYLFPTRLQIPYVTLTTFRDVWPARIPALPSHVPFHYSGYEEKMSFLQRVVNTLMSAYWVLKSRHAPELSPAIREKYAETLSDHNFDEMVYKSKLWFFNAHIALDFPKPSMPNVIHVGGMSTKPGNPLEANLQQFMDSSKHGVVVVSFGSVIHDIPLELNQRLLEVFRQLKWDVLWRNKNVTGLELPHNVRAMKWLPQNDLLAHPKTVAFITHCGNNGQFEAVFHAVPMVGFPIFVDQPYNARRMEAKGYGISLDLETFTAEQLVNAIETIVQDPSYRENIRRGSNILRSWPETAQQRAAFWVEHVLEHGADHLLTHALDMPWYQYLLLDVFFFLFIVLLIAITLIYLLLTVFVRIAKQILVPPKKKYQ